MAEPEAPAITGTITSSLVLAADDPAALAQFYGAVLNLEPQPGLSGTHWRVPWPAGGWLELYAPSKSRPLPRQPGRLALCLQRKAEGADPLAVLHALISAALELGASVGDPPRQEPFGAEARLLDPEGNRLLLLVIPLQPHGMALCVHLERAQPRVEALMGANGGIAKTTAVAAEWLVVPFPRSPVPLIQRVAPYPHWEFSDPSSGDLLRLVPERGGLISGWRCGGREVVYLDLERFLDPAQSVRGGFPVLFPITGGLPDNQLPLPQGTFTLGQHGFARTQPWRMEALADGRGVALELSDTAETLQAYPFQFLLRMEVRLAPGALEINTTVSNRSADPMPYSFGLHPYFNLSSLDGVRFEGLPADCLNHLTMAPASTAEQLDRLSQGIDLLVRPTGPVRLVDEAAGATLELQLSHPFDLVVLWTEPPRPMVCIEPWSGPRQALLSGDRKIELAPGSSTELTTRYAMTSS